MVNDLPGQIIVVELAMDKTKSGLTPIDLVMEEEQEPLLPKMVKEVFEFAFTIWKLPEKLPGNHVYEFAPLTVMVPEFGEQMKEEDVFAIKLGTVPISMVRVLTQLKELLVLATKEMV